MFYYPELFYGDCLDILPQIPDNSIDLILCDLPYGVSGCSWDIQIPLDKLWKLYLKVIKDKGAIVLFGTEPFSSHLRLSNLEHYRYDLIWNKVKPSNFQMMNFQPGRIHEFIHVFSKSPAVFCKGKNMNYYPVLSNREKIRKNGNKVFYGSSQLTLREGSNIHDLKGKVYSKKYPTSILTFSNANLGTRFHPAQKPLELLMYLIEMYSKEGDTILDNAMGSGSTIIAAYKLKRKSIGIEINKNFFEIANKRLEEEIGKSS